MPIVVGYLSSKEGEAALEAAVTEAQRRDGRLVVVLSRRGRQEDHAALDAEADTVRDRLDAVDVGYEVRPVRRGQDVAEDIVRTAEETDAELIVIGLRRRTPVGKLLLGSNAQRILLEASCPVLAVKPESGVADREPAHH